MTQLALGSSTNGGHPLTALLRTFRDQTGKPQADISRETGLDESYVSRLFSGERTNPSRDALVILCAWGLGLSLADTDEVLLAADYKFLTLPQSLR